MPTLNWIGKQAVTSHHKEVPFRLVEPVPELSAGDVESGNLIVQGDNLLALKALLPRYAGQVKCIYIDPPYNTGNEGWVYNDNVNSPEIRRWLGETVGKEGETLDRHDRWLCMMYPRLMLLKQFLREDGAIFISIDDNEVSNLRLIMDEVFGTSNFVATIAWQRRTSPDSRLGLSQAHDHILVFAKNKAALEFNPIPLSQDQTKNFKNPDNDPRGKWTSTDFTAQGWRPNQMYEIQTPSGEIFSPPLGRCWSNVENVFQQMRKDGRMWFGKDGNGRPRVKTYLSESSGVRAWTWWTNQDCGHNQEAKKEINDVLEHETPFDTPKPTRLIQRILQIATDKDSLVLDSFAGSGTTAHAVLKQNAEDGGNRRFILVEMDNTIAQTVTTERVKRVSQGYTNTKGKAVAGLGSGFQFYQLSHEPLFAADGKVRPDVTFRQLAEFVWFTETGTGLTSCPSPDKGRLGGVSSTPLLGIFQNRAIFMLYNGILKDKTDLGGNVLNAKTLHLLQGLLPEKDMHCVVFGARSRLDKATLTKLNITFHQLPYELAAKTWF
ncbi:site-specific DNA-methyltransferase [uncultured Thiothrix sp.]|uniref:site-specific DNA-methyltransferase n=1 Tax=uncultured Thiothrix sp. TaxID=223185 RepID=UPI0026096D87|nr:site-specific DNA-methyltransferase [uncultured Thiothrix sp.]